MSPHYHKGILDSPRSHLNPLCPLCVTKALPAKSCARHMHRSVLSPNARLGQPSEKRQAHRLCHQARWADHSEYIESMNWVKSVVYCAQLVSAGKFLSSLWLMPLISPCNCLIENHRPALKRDQNDFKTVGVDALKVAFNDSENNT